MREILHEEEGLVIALVADDEGAMVEVISDASGLDLSVPDEVIIVIDGEPAELVIEDAHRVYAVLKEDEDEDKDSMSLMVRVYEFFEGWEFDLSTDEEE